MRGNRLHVDATKKDKQHVATMAKGSKAGQMARPQAANPQKAGVTSHEVRGRAPGPKSAQGGGKKIAAYSPAKLAKPGITSPR
jgi:hypothetical protein